MKDGLERLEPGNDPTNEPANQNGPPLYPDAFSQESFWQKVRGFAARAGRRVIHSALLLYFCFRDPGTPGWVKASIAGALGYFIFPADAVPDVTPLLGYSDDLGVLTAALTYLATHVKPEHRQRAEEKLKTWFP